jgi:hypothetical protein
MKKSEKILYIVKGFLVLSVLVFGIYLLIDLGIEIKNDQENYDRMIENVKPDNEVYSDTVETYRIVKNVKEVNSTSTSYHYKYDWVNGKFRQQPRIESKTEYFVIYTDGFSEQVSKEKGLFYEKGDTVKFYTYK